VSRVDRFDDLSAGVLLADGAAETGDLATSAERVHEERVQAFHAGHGDVDLDVRQRVDAAVE
jgi:hypothetical protein